MELFSSIIKIKSGIGYIPINIILNRIYENSILVKFWRVFKIEIKQDQIRLRTFFQLQFMKKIIKLKQTFIKIINRVIIDLPAIERHLEGVIQMF
jgi:hypothetical protein